MLEDTHSADPGQPWDDRCDNEWGRDDIRDWPLSLNWHHTDEKRERFGSLTCSRRREEAKAGILLEASLASQTGRRVSFSCRPAFYVGRQRYGGPAFTHAFIVPMIKQLGRDGLVDVTIAPGRGPSGTQSTLSATDKLLQQMRPDFVNLVGQVPRELVRLRDAGGRLTDYRDDACTSRMRRKLFAINEAIASARIGFPTATGADEQKHLINSKRIILYRVFNVDFKNGGRMYGPWWQGLPKSERSRITLDGMPVVELDHSQLHPRLLYKLYGRPIDGDAYTIDGWERRLVKVAFNILLNAATYTAALWAIAGQLNGDRAEAAHLIEAVKQKHHRIGDAFHTGVGLRLQTVDANMAEEVLIRLMGHGVVALPVHDSFIVKAQHEGLAAEAMDRSFREVAIH